MSFLQIFVKGRSEADGKGSNRTHGSSIYKKSVSLKFSKLCCDRLDIPRDGSTSFLASLDQGRASYILSLACAATGTVKDLHTFDRDFLSIWQTVSTSIGRQLLRVGELLTNC